MFPSFAIARVPVPSLLPIVAAMGLAACASVPGDSGDRDVGESTSALTAEDFFRPTAVHAFALSVDAAGMASLAREPKTPVPGSFTHLGVTHQVTIRLKGSIGSLRPITDKPAFKVKFKKGDEFFGLKNLTLNNMVQDATMTHEVLAYDVYRAAGVHVPRAGYATVSLNGQPYGLYLDLETIDARFLEREFGDHDGILYEGGGGGADVTTAGQSKMDLDEGDDPGRAALTALVAAAETPGDGVLFGPSPSVDTSGLLAMMAASVVLGDWDNYYSPNNFRIYRSTTTGLWSFLPTGTDQALASEVAVFGGRGFFFQKCFATERCTVAFTKEVRRVAGVFDGLGLAARANALESVIATAVAADTKRPYDDATMTSMRARLRTFVRTRSSQVLPALGCVSGDHEVSPSACVGRLLVNAQGGSCVDVAGGSRDDGANVFGWTCHGAPNQRWDFVRSRVPGYVSVVARHSGKCLDVWRQNAADGADVRQYRCNGQDNQLWSVKDSPEGLRLVSRLSDKCLDLFGGAAADGTDVVVWGCHGGPNQAWTVARSTVR
ncbi:MAG: RICIN domain-containing protein [Polyangiaceae bacterium]